MFQVETGVAKLNTVKVISAVEPHLVTTVSNSSMKVGIVGISTQVTNGLMAGGQRNLGTGQQMHHEDGVVNQREDLLTFSPDEQHPLLDREQLPAQSTRTGRPLCHHHDYAPLAPGSPDSNYNNNNSNRTAIGLDFQLPVSELQQDLSTVHQLPKDPCKSSENVATSSQPLCPLKGGVLFSSQEKNMASSQIEEAQEGQAPATERQVFPFLGEPYLVSSLGFGEDPNDDAVSRGRLRSQTPIPPSSAHHTQSLKSGVQGASCQNLASASEVSGKLTPEDLTLERNPNHMTLRKPSALQLAALSSPVLATQAPAFLRPQRRVAKAKRPERPSSLDLSASCVYSGNICSINTPLLTYCALCTFLSCDLIWPPLLPVISSSDLFYRWWPLDWHCEFFRREDQTAGQDSIHLEKVASCLMGCICSSRPGHGVWPQRSDSGLIWCSSQG